MEEQAGLLYPELAFEGIDEEVLVLSRVVLALGAGGGCQIVVHVIVASNGERVDGIGNQLLHAGFTYHLRHLLLCFLEVAKLLRHRQPPNLNTKAHMASE